MKMSRLGLAASLLLLAALPAAAKTAGQLLNVSGSVVVERPGAGSIHAEMLFQLAPGDIIRVGSNSRATVVLYQNGREFMIGAGSTAVVQPTQVGTSAGTVKYVGALNNGFLGRIGPSSSGGGHILGFRARSVETPGAGPRMLSPIGAVRGDPVTLSWSGTVNGDSLRLRIRDASGEHTMFAKDLPPTDTQFQLPAGVLLPGETYTWAVSALKTGDDGDIYIVQERAARITLLTEAQASQLSRIEASAVSSLQASPQDPSPLLLLAQAYTNCGLYEQAAATYRQALQLRPGSAGILAGLRGVDRLQDEALAPTSANDAIAALKDLLKQYPDDRDALKDLADLQGESPQ